MTLWTVAHQASAHVIFQARILEWVAIPPAGDLPDPGIEYSAVAEFSALAGAFFIQGIFPTQGSNPGLLHCRQMLYPLSHQGSPKQSLQKKKKTKKKTPEEK